MTKVHGHITRKGVKGTITQNGAFNWSYYWLTRYPSALTLTDNGELSITLNWTNNGTGYDGIKIERSADGVTYAVIATLGVVVTYTDTAPADGTFYYRIRYYKGSSYSAYSNIDSIAVESWNPALSTPSAVTLTVVNDTQINVAFNINGTGQDGHKIYISTDGVTFTENSTVLGATATKQVTGLTPYTKYYFYVVAYKGSQESTASNVVNDTTAPPAIISDASNRLWIDYLDLTTITKDGSDLVSAWNDKLASGRNMVQADAGLQPLYTADGIVFTATAAATGKKLSATNWGQSFIQPYTFYTIMKVNSIGWNCGAIGNDATQLVVFLRTGTPKTISVSSNVESAKVACPLNEYFILKAQLNGANSWFQINDNDRVTGNFGTLCPWETFNIGIGAGAYSNVAFKELIFRLAADSDPNVTLIDDYLKKKTLSSSAPAMVYNAILTPDETNYITTEDGNYYLLALK
jgi:hypothetical protein